MASSVSDPAAANSSNASQYVKDLAEAYSVQSRLSNRLWISVIVISLLILLPIISPDGNLSHRELPFKYGVVDRAIFDVTALLGSGLTT